MCREAFVAAYSSTLTLSVATIKQGDTYPALTLTLADSEGPIDLTNATTVRFVMKGQTSATISPTGGGTCTVVEAAHGTVSYAWQSADTQTPDTYGVEALITWTGGGKQTVPNSAQNNPQLEIDPQLDAGAGL